MKVESKADREQCWRPRCQQWTKQLFQPRLMASERTPLLVEQGSLQHETEVHEFPSLKRSLHLLSTRLPLSAESIRELMPDSAAASISHQHAFFFAVVLHLEASVNSDGTSTAQHISAIARTVHGLTMELWASYSELRLEEADVHGISVQHEILELLWTPILVDDENGFSPEYTTGEELFLVPLGARAFILKALNPIRVCAM